MDTLAGTTNLGRQAEISWRNWRLTVREAGVKVREDANGKRKTIAEKTRRKSERQYKQTKKKLTIMSHIQR